MTQLAFHLPPQPQMGREDFLEAPCNGLALSWIERWPDWPAQALVLCGPEGSGKTHLANIFAARAGAAIVPAARFTQSDVPALEGKSVGIAKPICPSVPCFICLIWPRKAKASCC